MWMHPHTNKLMETNTNTPEAKQPASAGCITRLVRLGRDRWFWTHDKDAEEWMGPFKTIDAAIADAEIYRSTEWYPGTLTGPIYVGLGTRTTKAEREDWGVDFTHQIDSDNALKIYLPNS